MGLSVAQFHGLARQLRSGGFTVDPTTGAQPSSGVSVAVEGHEETEVNATGGALAQYAGRHREVLSEPGMHLGAWRAGLFHGPPVPGSRAAGEPTHRLVYDAPKRTMITEPNLRHADVLDVAEVIPEHPRGHHIAEVHHRMHVNRQDAAFDLATGKEIANPQAPYTVAEKEHKFGAPDEYGSAMRIIKPANRRSRREG